VTTPNVRVSCSQVERLHKSVITCNRYIIAVGAELDAVDGSSITKVESLRAGHRVRDPSS
jgi:hypothetical protein